MKTDPQRVMIYVQHLLGIGHLNRSLLLAGPLQQQGFDVSLVSGGMPQPKTRLHDFKIYQLDPVRSKDDRFTALVNSDGDEVDDDWKMRRKQQLLDLFAEVAPDALITETFPFGRRMMRFELIPLLDACRSSLKQMTVIASIRDILQPKSRPERNVEICQLIQQYYDHVLVHGDASVATLEDSFSLAAQISDKVSYSGYICNSQPAAAPPATPGNEVIVSAGGSATGLAILKAAVGAKPLSLLRDARWRIMVSPAIAERDYLELKKSSSATLLIERNRADFTSLISTARLSISQAGYNTVTDLLQTDTPAIIIPFAAADEQEQTIRSRCLQQAGRVAVIAETDLNAERLATTIDQVSTARQQPFPVQLDGARQSANLIQTWLNQSDA
ncbi:MAG: putative glycosyltransferase [Gammaproteobacteria bacterium]